MRSIQFQFLFPFITFARNFVRTHDVELLKHTNQKTRLYAAASSVCRNIQTHQQMITSFVVGLSIVTYL